MAAAKRNGAENRKGQAAALRCRVSDVGRMPSIACEALGKAEEHQEIVK